MTEQQIDLHQIATKVQLMKKVAEELKGLADRFPAVDRNAARILASLKMLEISVFDVLNLD